MRKNERRKGMERGEGQDRKWCSVRDIGEVLAFSEK